MGEGESGRLETCNDCSPSLRLSQLFRSSPVLGYLGCIGRWFDWPLVIRLAEALPQARIELVGPCSCRRPKQLPANVRLLPACKQSEAAGHLARFSAGLIPFRSNALTAGVDPIKYYDYRAAGLPVLSTRFGEMALRGRDDGVYFLDQADNLAETVSAALDHATTPPRPADSGATTIGLPVFAGATIFDPYCPRHGFDARPEFSQWMADELVGVDIDGGLRGVAASDGGGAASRGVAASSIGPTASASCTAGPCRSGAAWPSTAPPCSGCWRFVSAPAARRSSPNFPTPG